VRALSSTIVVVVVAVVGCGSERPPAPAEPAPPPEPRAEEAEAVEDPVDPPPVVAVDTHVDTTQRMLDGDDIAERLADGHLDIPRMREGGLHGAFFSIWVNPRQYQGEAAWERALALTRAVHQVAERHPEQAAVCTTAAQVSAAALADRVCLLIGVEGGHALGSDDPEVVLERLREMHELGARYMTITWSTDNPLGHSSTGEHPELGLTDLGRRVVREMNELGMIVDVSHVSDQTFEDIMDVTEKPVFASHSSARALAEHPRNMTDAMIRRVAEGGGAVCVNYYSQYIDIPYRDHVRRLREEHADRFEALAEEHGEDWMARVQAERELAASLDPELTPPGIEQLGAHFAHIVEVAGPEAACLGSDFDGIPELPTGLEDVSKLPALRAELERRELPVRPIFGGNVLRILEAQ